MLGVIKLGAFRRLFAAFTLNELTFSFGSLALALLVYRRTHTAAGTTGFFLCSQFVPALFAPFLVARVDLAAPHRALLALYGVEALAFLSLAYVAGHFSIVAALVIITFDGVLALTARAVARSASAATTAPRGLLREGNAVLNGAFAVCFMAGPALGAILVASGGVRGALLVNAGVFAAIGVIVGARALPHPAEGAGRRERRLRTGLAYVRGHPSVRLILGLWSGGILFFTLSIPVEVILAEHTLHAGAGGYAALLSVWGAGSVLGSVFYARAHRASPRAVVTLGAAALAVGFGGMAAAPSIAVAAAAAGVAGAGNGVVAVALRTLVQEQIEGEWMTLVMSLSDSLTQGAMGAGILLGGAIAGIFSARAALACGGAGALLTAALAWRSLSGPRLARPPVSAPPPFPQVPTPGPGAAEQAEQVGLHASAG